MSTHSQAEKIITSLRKQNALQKQIINYQELTIKVLKKKILELITETQAKTQKGDK